MWEVSRTELHSHRIWDNGKGRVTNESHRSGEQESGLRRNTTCLRPFLSLSERNLTFSGIRQRESGESIQSQSFRSTALGFQKVSKKSNSLSHLIHCYKEIGDILAKLLWATGTESSWALAAELIRYYCSQVLVRSSRNWWNLTIFRARTWVSGLRFLP